ncbi:MAG: NAD(P)/FAD-dependent oxidoreductase [Candidatus Thermoplasmatota archaeon]
MHKVLSSWSDGKMKVDCLVVGAGPAGSVAAKEMAKRGFNTILVEKKQEIGIFKRCAEGVTKHGLEKLGIKVNEKSIANRIRGAILYSPSGKYVVMEGNDMEGYILERKIFEKYLASEAIRNGAKCMVKAQVMEMKRENSMWKANIRTIEGNIEVSAKMVIGADGVESKIGRWAGINSVNKLSDYHSCFQYEMANVKVDEKYIHLFFGNDVAPCGYAWIFPKEFSANVGLGILEKKAKMKAFDYLKKFIEQHKEIFINSYPIEINAGGVPVAHYTDMVSDGLMLVGDAAQLVNPIHGGGIVRAIHSSIIASEVAEKAFNKNDLSKEFLKEYERRWNEEYGEKTEKLMRLRYFLEKLEDKDFETLAEILQGEDIFQLTQAKTSFFLKKLIKKPSLLLLAKKYLM